MSVLLNNGNGTLAPRMDYATGAYPASVAAADINGDAHPDLVVANTNGNTVSVLLNNAPSEVVTFPDPNLEAAIRQSIGKLSGDISSSDLATLTSFSAPKKGIANLSGLQYCSNLTLLYLNQNQISNLTPLSSLTNLTEVFLNQNQISNLTPLSSLTKLTWLNLDTNQISNITPLSSLTKLTGLSLATNQISNLTPLSSLTNLTFLVLWQNQISNLTPLSSLTNLTWLDIGTNQISDIMPLVNNTGLSAGDLVNLKSNPLSVNSISIYIPQLQARGVNVEYDQSAQPLLKAPWAGTAKISQGNNGVTSHHDYGTWDNTYAVDVALPPDTDVLAPADGIVKYVDDDVAGAGGKELAIEHTGLDGKKYITVYLHLNKILVGLGSSVQQGQVVAKSGDTGNVTGPHLHFHMWNGVGSYDSHTMPIERLVMKQVGVDSDFREYDARKGKLDDSIVKDRWFESNNIPINHPPVAQFMYSPYVHNDSLERNPAEGETITFSATYLDQDGDNITFIWAFEGGRVVEGNPVTHTYNSRRLHR